MKIVFVIHSLLNGGAERVVCRLANEMVQRSMEVEIITIREEASSYELDPLVKREFLFKKSELTTTLFGKIKRRLLLLKRLRSKIKSSNADVISSHMLGMNRLALFSSFGLRIPIVMTEQNNHLAYRTVRNIFERRFLYKFAAAVTVLTHYDFDTYYSKFLNNVVVMPNPTSFTPLTIEEFHECQREKICVAVGSMDTMQKGFDNLIGIFAACHKVHPEWKLLIAGTGRDIEKYKKRAASLGLADAVVFLGRIQDVKSLYKKSSIFILSSRYEGFSLVVLESISCGAACASYDCIAGPSEIIENNKTGILVEDQNKEELAKAVIKLMGDEPLRARLAENGLRRANDFTVEKITDKWEELFMKIKERS